MDLQSIQDLLRELNLDGWLFFDHHERDPLAYRVLGFTPPRHVTRRWYYLIPASGEPRGLVHRIESTMLDALPGKKAPYASWQTLHSALQDLLQGCRRVAMQYSPGCAVPYVAMVDAGTVEQVRSLGVEVISSADLIQFFDSRWTAAQLEMHLEAGRIVDEVRRQAFAHIGNRLRSGAGITEFDVKQFIREGFDRGGVTADHGPIVAVNDNASNPHYEPFAGSCREVNRGDLVLIDLWAKLNRPGAVYYDITWTGFCGPEVPAEVLNVFEVVRGARDSAIRLVQERTAVGQPLRGFEVDDAARGYVRERGFAEYFVHRTGHSIGPDVHGTGANMDNLETHDERRVIAGTCFSIEPGVYLPKFGIRSEVNMYVGEREAIVTGEVQQAPVLIA